MDAPATTAPAFGNDRQSSDDRPRLVETLANPIPDTARPLWIDTPDGVRLRVVRWDPAVRPSRGTVLLVPGRAEWVEKYFETAEDFRARGFGVVAFDWRGQGLSDRLTGNVRVGHVERFEDYVIDLETVIRDVALPDCKAPFHLVAHSMGGLVTLLAGPRITSRIRRMVLLAPLVAFGRALPLPEGVLNGLAASFTFVGLGTLPAGRPTRPEPLPFVGNRLTGDPMRFSRNRAILDELPELELGPPSFGWLHAAHRAMKAVRRPALMAAHTVPTLFVSAGADRVVSSPAIEAYALALRAGAYLDIPGARHELLQERDTVREPLMAAIDAFVPGTGED